MSRTDCCILKRLQEKKFRMFRGSAVSFTMDVVVPWEEVKNGLPTILRVAGCWEVFCSQNVFGSAFTSAQNMRLEDRALSFDHTRRWMFWNF